MLAVVAQLKGVVVEGSGWTGVRAEKNAVVQVEGCTMRDNSRGDYKLVDGGRIERTETPPSSGNAGQPVGVGVAEGAGSRAVVSTEAELL